MHTALLLLLSLFLIVRGQQTPSAPEVSPPSRPPQPDAAPLAAVAPGSPEAAAMTFPAGGTVYCCSRWWSCRQGYHCEAYYPTCRGFNCPRPYSRCVPNCPYGETWVDCRGCTSERYCPGGARPNCNPSGYCVCNPGTYRVGDRCVRQGQCSRGCPFGNC